MPKTIKIDPITRIEGHLAISLEIEDNKVIDAKSSGEMFRGFEVILKGRDPLDAQQITQRICGVCPVSHGIASILAQDMAYGIEIPQNGRIVRNLILGAEYIHSHIIHFYHLCALDFIDIAAITNYKGKDQMLLDLKEWASSELKSKKIYPISPFLPRYETKYLENQDINISAIKNYLDAFDARAMAHKMSAIFSGKVPHAATLIPGGVTESVTAEKIAAYKSLLIKLKQFIEHAYINDVLFVAEAFPDYFSLGKGCGNFLAYGVFPESSGRESNFFPEGVIVKGKLMGFNENRITEDVKYSRYSSPSELSPIKGETVPDPKKYGAYSWLKSPRYDEMPMEVGPLARIMVSYLKGDTPEINKLVDGILSKLGKKTDDLASAMGRHAARAIECKIVADKCLEWVEQLIPDQPVFRDFNIPKQGVGVGLTEAMRGALGHWIEIDNYKIKNYQCIVPTTWNCSPKDDKGTAGPIEQALIGTLVADSKNPIEAVRIVRSFDPCIACAVH
ncbi:MAG: nickel-dependent hydrogenase large subunit [Desulfobacterales bacterium]|nr:nickel-dependent hydrogenase large subunit [Desulfobacterales bacterium]MBF0397005.1 nickel-dependent hydrogenase large subunit [Desulfobacterales bacterium]